MHQTCDEGGLHNFLIHPSLRTMRSCVSDTHTASSSSTYLFIPTISSGFAHHGEG